MVNGTKALRIRYPTNVMHRFSICESNIRRWTRVTSVQKRGSNELSLFNRRIGSAFRDGAKKYKSRAVRDRTARDRGTERTREREGADRARRVGKNVARLVWLRNVAASARTAPHRTGLNGECRGRTRLAVAITPGH